MSLPNICESLGGYEPVSTSYLKNRTDIVHHALQAIKDGTFPPKKEKKKFDAIGFFSATNLSLTHTGIFLKNFIKCYAFNFLQRFTPIECIVLINF